MRVVEPKCRYCKGYVNGKCENENSLIHLTDVEVMPDDHCDMFELDGNKTVKPIDSTDIKVTGSPLQYGNGATRCSKEGKGRFDLIPSEVFAPLFDTYDDDKPFHISKTAIITDISRGNWIGAIIRLTELHYGSQYGTFDTACWPMLRDLAVHFQKGADIYGERNCQRGIPQWSFKDSAMRHATQYFMGLDDEPHLISAIWNLWMYGWSEITGVGTLSCIKTDSEGIYEL